MINPKHHIITKEGTTYNYLLFDNVGAFNAFIDHENQQLSSPNATTWEHLLLASELNLGEDSTWYGTPPPTHIGELENHTSFLGMNLLKEIQPKIKNHLGKYLEMLNDNIMPKPKATYNDRGLGMFSFDRAAMGLYQQKRVNTNSPINTVISQLKIAVGQNDISTKVKSVYAYFKDKNTSLPSCLLYTSPSPRD